jgi:hypothetical protein
VTEVESAIALQRHAADNFKSAALRVPEPAWNVPRAPGKWSPAQVTDHVGVTTKVAHDALAGRANMGGIPKFLRPIAGAFFFKPVIAKGFPKKGKGPAIMAPAHEPMPREQLLRRLDDEVESIARAAADMARAGRTHFEHSFFGRLAVADYIRFNALHLDHHREQLPSG